MKKLLVTTPDWQGFGDWQGSTRLVEAYVCKQKTAVRDVSFLKDQKLLINLSLNVLISLGEKIL